ncbi:MAG TPA: hypothetical protein VFA59_06680 [Vicinamibacterales bacterium]|nr:hypothetical protein [Vicinamibacterales bacterium]
MIAYVLALAVRDGTVALYRKLAGIQPLDTFSAAIASTAAARHRLEE